MPLDPRAIIADGENAKIGFKRDDRNLLPEHLAREIVAFANMNGGMIVVGVEDDGNRIGRYEAQLAGMADGHRDRSLR